MKDTSISGQVFSLLTVAIMLSSAWVIYNTDIEELEVGSRVPVWARSQLPYDTTQAYSFVLQQGKYELLETENQFNSEHVYVEYDLPIGEGGAAVTCEIGMDCPQISLAFWSPKSLKVHFGTKKSLFRKMTKISLFAPQNQLFSKECSSSTF